MQKPSERGIPFLVKAAIGYLTIAVNCIKIFHTHITSVPITFDLLSERRQKPDICSKKKNKKHENKKKLNYHGIVYKAEAV